MKRQTTTKKINRDLTTLISLFSLVERFLALTTITLPLPSWLSSAQTRKNALLYVKNTNLISTLLFWMKEAKRDRNRSIWISWNEFRCTRNECRKMISTRRWMIWRSHPRNRRPVLCSFFKLSTNNWLSVDNIVQNRLVICGRCQKIRSDLTIFFHQLLFLNTIKQPDQKWMIILKSINTQTKKKKRGEISQKLKVSSTHFGNRKIQGRECKWRRRRRNEKETSYSVCSDNASLLVMVSKWTRLSIPTMDAKTADGSCCRRTTEEHVQRNPRISFLDEHKGTNTRTTKQSKWIHKKHIHRSDWERRRRRGTFLQ